MSTSDLTAVLASHLDPHLALHLLDFAIEKGLYDEKDLVSAKIELIRGTEMVDLYEDVYKKHNGGSAPPDAKEAAAKREGVYARLKSGKEATAALRSVFEHPESLAEARAAAGEEGLTIKLLSDQFVGIDGEKSLDALYDYALVTFGGGLYRDAAGLLEVFAEVCKDDERVLRALWGKLAADILSQDWGAARDALYDVRDRIDSRPEVDQLVQLQQRTWLIHWALFVFFNGVDDGSSGSAGLIEFVFDDSRLLNAVQMNCPHILRYLGAAVVISARRKELFRLVRIVQQETEQYEDPVTQFLVALYHDFDFERARERLVACESLISGDYFLSGVRDEFFSNARALVFETTCRVHKTVDIRVLAKRLDLDDEKDESQAVMQLIRGSRMEARIDSDSHAVVMGAHHPTIYQQIIDATRDLSYRSQQIIAEVEKRYDHMPADADADDASSVAASSTIDE